MYVKETPPDEYKNKHQWKKLKKVQRNGEVPYIKDSKI